MADIKVPEAAGLEEYAEEHGIEVRWWCGECRDANSLYGGSFCADCHHSLEMTPATCEAIAARMESAKVDLVKDVLKRFGAPDSCFSDGQSVAEVLASAKAEAARVEALGPTREDSK